MFHRLGIEAVTRETDDAVALRLAVPAALREAFAFAPGQYLTLRATLDGAEVRRSYSICSGLDDGELCVAVKHVPDGLFSHHANTALKAGDAIDVMPPEGTFGGAVGQDLRLHVAFAAGSGITPVLGILRSVLAREPHSRFVLFYGNRSIAGIMFRTALEDLKDRYLDRLTVIHVLSREQQDVPVLSGRLDADKVRALLPTVADPAAIDVAYLCGPAGMIDDVAGALRGLGVPAGRIRTERFVPAGGAPRAPRPAPVAADAPASALATIVFDGKTNVVPVAEGERVLDAALRAGLDLPWSCRGGMCSTCRAHLTEGWVTMDENYALEPWELEAGYVLTCQSHPVTPRVTLDYDKV